MVANLQFQSFFHLKQCQDRTTPRDLSLEIVHVQSKEITVTATLSIAKLLPGSILAINSQLTTYK